MKNFCWPLGFEDPEEHNLYLHTMKGGTGHCAVYYISPQSFKQRFIIRRLNNFGDIY